MSAELDATLLQPAAGQVVGGRYELVSELGRGGMGSVWRARNVALEAACAVKFMHAEFAGKEDLRKRFVREARAAAQLSSPHIVTVFDVGVWNDRPFMAMELMSGESLEQRLERERTLSIDITLEVITQVARGLEAAHAADLVHRDLKPENIFLLSGPRIAAKILDFGVAKHLEATSGVKTVNGALIGTPYYMSPEQVRGEASVDHRSDVWSLGVVAFACLTGKLPFSGDTLPSLLGGILHGAIPEIGIPGLESFWRRASQRDPEQRFQTATELADALRDAAKVAAAAASGVRASVPRPSAAPRPSDAERYRSLPMRRDGRLLYGVGGAIAVLAGTWFAMSSRHEDKPPHIATAQATGTAIVPEAKPTETHAAAKPDPKPEPPPRVATSGFALESTPSGATVIVDGARVAHVTPLRLTDLAPGAHKVSLERSGYRPYSVSIDLVPGQVLELPKATLVALAAAASEPRSATAPHVDKTSAPPTLKPRAPAQRPQLGKYDDRIGF